MGQGTSSFGSWLVEHPRGAGASGRGRSGFPRLLSSTARRRYAGLLSACLTVLGAAWLLLGVGAAAAAPSAGTSYAYSHSFATEGQLGSPNPSTSLAIEPGTGNVLAPDVNSGIAVFAPDSTAADPALTTFDSGVSPGALAVDQDSGAAYVRNRFDNALTRWTSDGAAVPTYTQDPDFSVEVSGFTDGGIAVDATTGDLLVLGTEGNEVIRFDASGTRLSSFPVPSDSLTPVSLQGVAVAADGRVYVSDETYGNGPNKLRQLSATGEFLGLVPVAGSVKALAPDPVTGGIVVLTRRGDAFWIEGFDVTGEHAFEAPLPESLQGAAIGGIAVDGESERLYVLTGGNVSGIHVFTPVPAAGTEPPTVSAVTDTTAHLSAEVDPGAGPPPGSFAAFELSADGGDTWTSTPSQEVTAPGPVEADLTGLEPNFDYLVRTVVGNELERHVSNPTSFSTLPVAPLVVTGAATDVSETTAVINGTINPAGLQTTYYFEYGLTDAYGSRVPAAIDAVAGNGHAPRIFSRTLEDLQPGTTYHYRIVAENEIGVSQGEDRTFTALAPAAIPARAYEQVTPVEKRGATVDATVGFQAAPDGSAISYITRSAPDPKSSPQFGRFMSYRGSTDWQGGIPTDPPLNTARTTLFTTTLAISDDFAHAFVVSNRDLLGDGVENGANLYSEDLVTGEYTAVASSDAPFAFSSFTTLQIQNKFMWGNADYSELVFLSSVPLLDGVTSTALYRWSVDGGLQLESTLPDGSTPSSEAVIPSSSGDSRYVSEDGRRAYFTLTGGPEEGVYLSEDGQTRALSVSRRAGDPATPQTGLFLTASKDGRYGYFYSLSAPLTDDAPGLPGDIYRYDAVEDELEFIGGQAGPGFGPQNLAAIGVSDDGETFYFGGSHGLEVFREGTIRLVAVNSVGLGGGFVSPNGRYLGYGEESSRVVYLYDAVTEELTCASCLSDGSNPGGATLPLGERSASNQIPEAVTDQGELFFDTTARLVAADVNGEYDVYSFKEGKARLISPGDAPFPARYGDISEDGKDVFFTTAQKLVGRDNDQSFDIYDARIGGGLPAQSPPPPKECLRDDCKATPNAGPELPFGGSEALSGPGNVKPKMARKHCGKGRQLRKVKGKKRCVPKHKKAHHRKANSNRRQAR